MLIAPDNLHPWRDRREAEYEDMSYTEEEKYDHDRSYFLGRIFQALVSKTLTSQDMCDMLKILHNREDSLAQQCTIDKLKVVTVRVTDDELQHVSYDDAQLGREK